MMFFLKDSLPVLSLSFFFFFHKNILAMSCCLLTHIMIRISNAFAMVNIALVNSIMFWFILF